MPPAKAFGPLLAIVAIIGVAGSGKKPSYSAKALSQSIGCSPSSPLSENHGKRDGTRFPILLGWGNYHFSISSQVDSARLYFDQGISLYYSYHPDEALASFREAAILDPSSAMACWGQALSLGPSYNGDGYSMPGAVPSLLTAMEARTNGAAPMEKDLMAAMKLRYNPSGDSRPRDKLNRSYAEAMHRLIMKYPNSPDIEALYIDAVMLEHPWDFWYNDGNPKPWTAELVSICGEILKNYPKHPGAMHYYIHLTEASRHPEVALEDANQLKDLMPGVAHMVHMSSHVYERTGHYFEGVEVNDIANLNLRQYDSLETGSSFNEGNPHYLAVQAFCAMNAGMLEEGIPRAFKCRARTNPSNGDMYSQYLYMFPILAWVRMGQWKLILESPALNSNWRFAGILENFAKGIAWTRLNNMDSALECLREIGSLLEFRELKENKLRFNTALLSATIAKNILSAEISAYLGRKDSAIFYYESAIRAEDSLVYFEPKEWMIPARQFYGAMLLKWDDPVKAEEIYKEDLVWNPENGWSLFGLYQCAIALHKTSQTDGYKKKYLNAFRNSDLVLKGSVF